MTWDEMDRERREQLVDKLEDFARKLEDEDCFDLADDIRDLARTHSKKIMV